MVLAWTRDLVQGLCVIGEDTSDDRRSGDVSDARGNWGFKFKRSLDLDLDNVETTMGL